jgi:hypothetical protein
MGKSERWRKKIVSPRSAAGHRASPDGVPRHAGGVCLILLERGPTNEAKPRTQSSREMELCDGLSFDLPIRSEFVARLCRARVSDGIRTRDVLSHSQVL